LFSFFSITQTNRSRIDLNLHHCSYFYSCIFMNLCCSTRGICSYTRLFHLNEIQDLFCNWRVNFLLERPPRCR